MEGQGAITLRDIRLETVYLDEVADPAWEPLFEQREQLKRELRAVELALKRNQQARRSLEAIWGRLIATPKEGAEPVSMDPDQWAGILDFQGDRLAMLDEDTLEREEHKRDLGEAIGELNEKIEQFDAKRQRTRQDALVVVEADAPAKARLDLSYQVRGPSWSPSYQVRADSGRDAVTIVYRANVRQNTGEDWTGVALSLSTAQPQVGGREPKLTPWRLHPGGDVAQRLYGGAVAELTNRQMMNNLRLVEGADEFELAEAPMAIAQATVQAGVTASVFTVPGEVSVPADNQPVIATIQRFESPAHFRHTAVPKLSPHVYLKARITNASDAQLLPGPGSVFIDGDFVGKAPLELVSPDEKFWVYLGVDPAVQVKRKQLEGEKGTEGLFSKRTRVVRRYEFEIENRRRDAIDMVLWDQLPMAESEDIAVELLEPEYSGENTDDLIVTEEKFIEWGFDIPAGKKRVVPFSYAVESPKDMIVSGL